MMGDTCAIERCCGHHSVVQAKIIRFGGSDTPHVRHALVVDQAGLCSVEQPTLAFHQPELAHALDRLHRAHSLRMRCKLHDS